MSFCFARRDKRSPLFAAGSGELPQCADLSGTSPPTEGDSDLSLCSQTAWVSSAGDLRTRRPLLTALYSCRAVSETLCEKNDRKQPFPQSREKRGEIAANYF